MRRTLAAKPEITIDLIGHLLGDFIELRERILSGLEQTPLTGFLELDDGERLLLEGMFSRSRRIHTFGPGPQQDIEPWDQSKKAYEDFVRGAKKASDLLRPFYQAAPRYIHLRTRRIPAEYQDMYAALGGKRGRDLENRVDVDLDELAQKLAPYQVPETLFTLDQALAFAYQKPIGEPRLRELRGITHAFRDANPAFAPFLAISFDKLQALEQLRADLLRGYVRYVSSERHSHEVSHGANRDSLAIKPWLSRGRQGVCNGYDQAIAGLLREDYPRVYSEVRFPAQGTESPLV